jgi:pterin-4a-carbinolamine dehydratase
VSSAGKKWTWSAGCQVFKREVDFIELMNLAHLQIEHHPKWTTFTYTLIEEGDLL